MGVKSQNLGVLCLLLSLFISPLLGNNSFSEEEVSTCRQQDSLILVDFYKEARGDDWLVSWDLNRPMNQWFGVTLNALGCVTCIDLDGLVGCTISVTVGNGLSGSISPRVAELQALEKLLLANNRLGGTIPRDLFELPYLTEVDLFGNEIIGPLPASIGSAVNLQTLSVSGNNMTGPLPATIGNLPNIESLLLENNQFGGRIPEEIGNLTTLKILRLNGNDIRGEIPSTIGKLEVLVSLNLSNNNITGPLPAQIGSCTVLEDLLVTNNNLDSPMPKELGQLTLLRRLRLCHNNLDGEIPKELGDLENIKFLHLEHNNLEGIIPPEIGQCHKMTEFSVDHNNMSGNLPREIGQLDSLRKLHIGYNDFIGPLPSSIGNLLRLQEFKLSHNNFDGPLPERFGVLISMKIFEGSHNNFIGPLPSTVRNLDKLIEFDLEHNKIDGDIPEELGDLDLLYKLKLGDNRLSGCFPESLLDECGKEIDFSNNPELPWMGNFNQFCAGEEQVGAICNDGNPDSTDDEIQLDCSCAGFICSPLEIVIDAFICDNETITIGGVDYNQATTTTISELTSQGCDSTTYINVVQLTLDLEVTNVNCENDADGLVQIACSLPGIFDYKMTNSEGETISEGTQLAALPTSLDQLPTGNYTLTIQELDQTCEIVRSFDIQSQFKVPEPVFIDNVLCPGEELTLNETNYTVDNPSGQQALISADGCDSIINVDLRYYDEAYTEPDEYLTDKNEIDIAILENDEIPAGQDYTLSVINSVNIAQVEVVDNLFLHVETDGLFTGISTIEYEICMEDCSELCSRSSVAINTTGDEYDDGVLTPNEDGFNDVLVVTGYEAYEQIPNCKINIINRWGQIVYNVQNYENNWIGNHGGNSAKPLPEGVYYYHLIYNDGKSIMGSRSLIR